MLHNHAYLNIAIFVICIVPSWESWIKCIDPLKQLNIEVQHFGSYSEPSIFALRAEKRWKIMNMLKKKNLPDVTICISFNGEQLAVPPPPPFIPLSVFHFYFAIYSGVILAPYAYSLLSFFILDTSD